MGKVLLLASERARAADLRSLIRQDGHQVAPLFGVDDWRETERRIRPDLIIAAVASSKGVLEVPGRLARGFPAPLLFVQHETDFFREGHLDERLVDRIESPFMSNELLGRIDALLRARRVILRTHTPQDHDSGEPRDETVGLLRELGRRIGAVLGTRVPRWEKPLGPYLEVAARIADWADHRDVFEPGHAERVTSLAALIAEALGLPDEEYSVLMRAAMLHDIGKVALPVDLLRQRAPLDDDQRRLIRTHPERGARLLRALDSDERVAETILYHHEQPDGEGYYGKPPEEIPRAAAVLSVAEAYDAMTSSTLMPPLPSDRALDLLAERAGKKYDADSVEALSNALRPRQRAIPLSRTV